MIFQWLRPKTRPSPKPLTAAEASHPLQERLGYTFREPGWLLRALTHPSYAHEHPEEGWDNQRLEFLGDAVLSLTVAEWVFHRYPEFREGEMTRLRAVLVSEAMLARFAAQLGLGDFLRLGKGEEERGGRERAPNLADAFEAVVGAMYLDGGLEPVRAMVRFLMAPMAEAILAAEADKDAKSRLQEWAQAEIGVTPRYRIVAEHGPEHAKTFVAEVLLGDKVAGRGEGRSKQAAEQAAARDAWERRAEAILAAEADKDAKSRFQEWAQAEIGVTPRYRIVAEHGPEHAKTFVAEVLLGDKVAGQGEGRSKQAAEQAAARDAWERRMEYAKREA